MNYEPMFEQLKVYLDENIIKNLLRGYVPKSFVDNINNILEDLSSNRKKLEDKLGIKELTITNLLNKFEEDSNLESKKIKSLVNFDYNKVKNESGPFSSYQKEQICRLVVCFSLNKEKANILLGLCNILLKPLLNPHDAAYDFYVNKWHYEKDPKENMDQYIACILYTEKYVNAILTNHNKQWGI